MADRFLEMTFRNGRPWAGYLHLAPKRGDKSARTEKRAPGLLVDFAADGRPIGVEIVSPSVVTLESLNLVLSELGEAAATEAELRPLQAA
jgi:hypothetical protein